MGEHPTYYHRNLPHFQPSHAIFFVTFRLAGYLPQELIVQLKMENSQRQHQLIAIGNEAERKQAVINEGKRYFGKFDKLLDTNATGPHWLNDERVADLVAGSIHYRDGKHYDLLAYCIMPNHVHSVFEVGEYVRRGSSPYLVSGILENLKWYTAKECNRILRRTGSFWQHESYDHIVKDDRELEKIINYVLFNPVSAGLVDNWEKWKWSYRK